MQVMYGKPDFAAEKTTHRLQIFRRGSQAPTTMARSGVEIQQSLVRKARFRILHLKNKVGGIRNKRKEPEFV